MGLKYAVVLIAALGCVSCDVVKMQSCDKNSTETCSVKEVRIDTCQWEKDNCKLTKGTNVTLAFDFAPNFVAAKVNSMVFWSSPSGDMPFADFNTDGCNLTKCPTESGVTQTLEYRLYLAKKLPSGKFKLKWKVWDGEDDSQMCCFKTTIVIKKY